MIDSEYTFTNIRTIHAFKLFGVTDFNKIL
jgi:hypothetical protein